MLFRQAVARVILKAVFLTALVLLMSLISGCTKVQTFTQSEVVPYKSTSIEDPTLVKGVTEVKQTGIYGIRQAVYVEKISGSTIISRTKVKDRIIEKPVNEIVRVGTAPPVAFTLVAGGGAFEISMAAYGRKGEAVIAKKPVKGDFLHINGRIKNTGAKPAKTGAFLDLAAINPAIKGGLSFLAVTAPPQLAPGQTADIQWQGSINPGSGNKNTAIVSLAKIQVLPRVYIGPKNKPKIAPKSLEALAEN